MIISVLDSGLSGTGPGSSPEGDILFLAKTLNSLHLRVPLGTSKFHAGGNPAMD